MSNGKGRSAQDQEGSDDEQVVASQAPIQFAIRSESGVLIVKAQPPLSSLSKLLPDETDEDTEYIEARELEGDLQYSADGRLVAVIGDKVVRVLEAESVRVLHSLKRTGVDKIEFSPLGTYLVTWESKMRAGEPNLHIWDLKSGAVVKSFHQKETKERGQWPPFAWTSDEKLFGHLVTNQVNVYEGNLQKDIIARLRHTDVGQFSIAPGTEAYIFAVGRLPKSGQPGRVSVFRYPKFEEDDLVCSKSFFKADEIVIKWSPKANPPAMLIETNTLTSDSSYYGETNLYLMHADGKFDCAVPFGTDTGPIQDAQWSPKGREFAVIQGKQPAQAILFRIDDCKPTHHFGRSAMNTIRWSPHGRFLMLGGFGNCPGNMTFWDRNKKKIMGQVQDRDSPRSFEWSPDGRAFITAALRPHRTVANGFKVALRPAVEGVFPDRPQSPHLTDKRFKQENEKRLDAGKSKAYIPPSLRRAGGGPSNIMKKADEGPRTLSELEKTIVPGVGRSSTSNYVPGQGKAKPASKAAKKRKNKAKKVEDAKKEEEAKAEAEKEKKKAPGPSVDLSDKDAVAKKVKALKKKLRQVEQLREKLGEGAELDAAQKEKLEQEKPLAEEIRTLEEALK